MCEILVNVCVSRKNKGRKLEGRIKGKAASKLQQKKAGVVLVAL